MAKVVIFGSRDFQNQFQASLTIEANVLRLVSRESTVLHGNARGTDQIAAQAAERNGCEVIPFEADWDLYGKRAGIIRNIEMLKEEPDWALGFWNGVSDGSLHMIRECAKRSIFLIVVGIP